MAVWRDAARSPDLPHGSAVTVGAYDGVHRGHRAVIAELVRRAEAMGVPSAVVTFDRHPATVVRPESAPKQLTDPEQEIELLAATGVDHVVVLTFDEARSKESAEDFVADTLVGRLHAKLVLVGSDFHFGHERRGNVELLRRLGAELGFEAVGVDLVDAAGATTDDEAAKVSSTTIRAALEAGDLPAATVLLGRHHEVRGTVEHGDHRGREWGFPTANVHVANDVQLPADGIYAAWLVRSDDTVLPGAASLGVRPTVVADGYRLLEVHVLDTDDWLDLYGEHVGVRFVARLHGEEHYDSVDTLITKIGTDCAQAREILATAVR